MSKNTTQIPFTEIVERVIELARIREEVKFRVRGIVNDVYCREIPRKDDFTFFMNRTSLTITPEYNTGYITATTGSTAVTFTSATIPSDCGNKLKITNTNYIYDYTYSSSSSGTVSPAIVGDQNVSGGSYSIYKNIYDLPSNFDRFPKNGGIHIYYGGQMRLVPERNYDYYVDQFNSTPNDNTNFCRVTNYSGGRRQVEIIPPFHTQGSFEIDYLRIVSPMKENTAGTITITAGDTSVTGVGTQFTLMSAGDYLRVDGFGTSGDSEWYRISSITNDTALVLSSAFGNGSSASASKFTISSVPQAPEMIHEGIMFGTLAQVATDQNDPMMQVYAMRYAEVLSDAKRVYRTRLIRQDISVIGEEYHYRR